jgi:cysteinyl-tRNA synthetase
MKNQYREDRMWTEGLLLAAESELTALRSALSQSEVAPTIDLIRAIIDSLANDLDTNAVLASINSWVGLTQSGATGGDAQSLSEVLDALIGIKI